MKNAMGKIRWRTDFVSAIVSDILGVVLSILIVVLVGVVPCCTAQFMPTYGESTNIMQGVFELLFSLGLGLLFGSICVAFAAFIAVPIFLILVVVINALIILFRVKEWKFSICSA